MRTPKRIRKRVWFALTAGVVVAVMLGIAGASKAYVSYVNIQSPTHSSPVTVTSLPDTVSVHFHYSTTYSGTTTAYAWLTTDGSSCDIAEGSGTTIPSTYSGSASLDVAVPVGTANGSYQVCVYVYNPASSYPIYKTDSESGAVLVDLCDDPGSGSATGLPFTSSFGCSNTNTVNMDGWVDSDGSGTDALVTDGSPRPGGPTDQHARLSDGGTITRTIDTSGFQDIQLSYYWHGDSSAESTDYLRVYWKLNSSSSYTQLASYQLDSHTSSWSSQVNLSLPAAADDTTIQIRFRGDSNRSNEQARVDDVLVTGTEIAAGTTDVTPSITASDKTYDGTNAATFSCSLPSEVIGSDDVSCDGTGSATFSQADVGTNLLVTATGLSLTGSDAGKYSLTTTTATDHADINPAPVTATAGSGSATYDTFTHSPSACQVTGDYTGDLYCDNDPASVGPDAGTYTIEPDVYGTGLSNYDITTADGSYTINTATVTVTPVDQTITYGQTPDFTPDVSGLLSGDGWDTAPTCGTDVTSLIILPLSVVSLYDVGSYTISCTGADAGDNYTVAYGLDATLTVNKAPVTATAGSGSATFDTSIHSPSACQVTGDYTGDLYCDNDPASVGPDAGTYTIEPDVYGTGLSNYDITTANGSYTIGPATLTVTADDQTAQYSDATPTLTFQYSGFVGTDDATVIETQPTCDTTRLLSSAPGTFPITCSGGVDTEGNYTFDYHDGTLTVTKEDASVLFDDDNPVAYQVSEPGGSYDDGLTLYVNVKERQPDTPTLLGLPGDIGNSGLTDVTLDPLAGGPSITLTCDGGTSNGLTGYAEVLTYECSTSASIPVGTYDVTADVTGDYYMGEGMDGFTVYDPSLGFATGGGTFLLGGDRVNFGFVMKYTKKGNNVKGSFLAIRHYADGTIARIKSNALDGLALQTGGECGIATFSGKSTYRWWDPTANEGEGGYLNVGGQDFAVYAEDCNEPGTGEDYIWIRGTGDLIMPSPATSNTAVLTGGNIAVPHNGN